MMTEGARCVVRVGGREVTGGGREELWAADVLKKGIRVERWMADMR